MSRFQNYVALQQILATEMNAIQDAAIVEALAVGGASPYTVSATSVLVTVRPIRACVIGNVQYATAADLTYVPAGLGVNSWNYVYLKVTAGALALEISTTAPDATLVFKTGDTSRRYVCAFFATAANAIRGFRKAGPIYRLDMDTVPTFTPADSTGAGVWVDLALGTGATGFVPPTARIAYVNLLTITNTAATQTVAIRTKGAAGITALIRVAVAGIQADTWVEILTDAAQTIQYANSAAGTLVGVVGLGFTEGV